MSHYRFSADGLGVEEIADGAIVMCIPCDPANADYARLLADGVEIAPHRPPPTLEEAKAAKLHDLAAHRFARETAGHAHDGFLVRTDRESQAALGNAVQLASIAAAQGQPFEIVWKGAAGFRAFDAAGLVALGLGVGGHVAGCFAREASLAAEIAALDSVAAVAAFDLAVAWP